MSINTNSWNRLRYTLYTPGYDKIARIFEASRIRSIESLKVGKGDKILIVGAGTGLTVVSDEPADWHGNFRLIKLIKK